MNYLYHSVPKDLKGNILYPLNVLKEKFPEIYKQQFSKYAGREHITKQIIPILDCLWNDVLHFSAVKPREIKQSLIEAGYPDFKMSYYEIDSKLIEPKNAIVYLYNHTDNKDKMNIENFAPYNPDEVATFSTMPQATKDYYKEMINKGERPLLHHRIPHILYKGTLDINGVTMITI
ncbi:hypothetical protein EXS61_02080 [Candidatus Parcubacteria bacterium]|nr:hypothetical protein [Candidatus Parcubacteria bacterium]